VSLAMERAVAKTTLTTKTASMDQATQVQRLPTALPPLECFRSRPPSVVYLHRPESVTDKSTPSQQAVNRRRIPCNETAVADTQ
jgi:hypothetical protein